WHDVESSWIGRIFYFHKRNGIDTGISVAPVGLKAGEISADRPVEQSTGEHSLAGFHRRTPAVFIDASENAVGFAARAAYANKVEQDIFGALALPHAVERQRQLFLNHNSGRQRFRHPSYQCHHLRPGFY